MTMQQAGTKPGSREPLEARTESANLLGGVLLDLGNGRLVRGVGPFQKLRQAPAGEWAFYVNDFSLSDPEPWLVPQRLEFLHEEKLTHFDKAPIRWQEPEKAKFAEVFSDIMSRINSGELRKAVPATVAHTEWTDERKQQFLSHLPDKAKDAGTHAYAFDDVLHHCGFAGRTPEVLFRVEDGILKTMALAGTAPTSQADQLLQNPKLLREHDLVVEVMSARLKALGELTVEPRRLMSLGVMTHLCTRLEVVLDDPNWESRGEELIRLLHPTPALGIAPRTPETLALLNGYRQTLGVPERFGAPIGVKWPGGLLVLVAIRGIFWEQNHASLPAGGGLVKGSELDAEWAELELKRRWVRQALQLND